MELPRIGVTGPASGGHASWMFTNRTLRKLGAYPIRLTPDRPASHQLDGLILGGGADIDPSLYAEEEAPRTSPVKERLVSNFIALLRGVTARKHRGAPDRDRDEFETSLLAEAISSRLPVLGICRGAQLINVFFGGSLHQDLRSFYVEEPEVRSIFARKRILIEPRSKLFAFTARHHLRVNALHHQAIDRLGSGLSISARDKNGIVQAIEHDDLPFVLGVQWHPEFLPTMRPQRALFSALCEFALAHMRPVSGALPLLLCLSHCFDNAP